MRFDRVGNAKKNMVFGVANRASVILLPFIVRTVIKKTVGVDYLGLNSLFASILTVLSMAELGFSSAIVYNMYKPVAEDDYDTIRALLNYYRKVYRIIGLAVLLIGLLLMPYLPKLIHGDVPADINLYVLYLIYLINTALSYFLFAYLSSLIAAYQRNDVISRNNMIATIGMNAAQIVVLLTLRNYYVFAIMMPVFTIFNNVRLAIVAKKMYPHLKAKGNPTAEMIRDIKKRVSGLMVSKMCGVSRNALDSIFISSFLGLTITAMYNNYYYIMTAITSMILLVNSSILSGVGNSLVVDSVEKNYRDMNRYIFLYMWVAGWCTACLVCLYQPFMRIWMGEAMMFPMHIVIMLSLYFYMLAMGDIRETYAEASGLWWEHRYRSIAQTVVNLTLNYLLGKWFGVTGIVAATLISLFFVDFCYGSSIIFKYVFTRQKPSEYYLRHLLYLAVTACACGATYYVCSLVHLGNWGTLLVRGLICCIMPNLLYIIAYRRYKLGMDSIKWLRQTVFGK